MTIPLPGGRKHDSMPSLFVHGAPDLSHPKGVHGTIQLSVSGDLEAVKDSIRNTFFREERLPGMHMGTSDIHMIATDNGDGTMEVSFEVQD